MQNKKRWRQFSGVDTCCCMFARLPARNLHIARFVICSNEDQSELDWKTIDLNEDGSITAGRHYTFVFDEDQKIDDDIPGHAKKNSEELITALIQSWAANKSGDDDAKDQSISPLSTVPPPGNSPTSRDERDKNTQKLLSLVKRAIQKKLEPDDLKNPISIEVSKSTDPTSLEIENNILYAYAATLRPDATHRCLLDLWCESNPEILKRTEQYKKLYMIQLQLRDVFEHKPKGLVTTMETLRNKIRNHVDTPTTSDTSNPTKFTPANTQASIETICTNLKTASNSSPEFNNLVQELLQALKDADPEPDRSVIEATKPVLRSILQNDAIRIKRKGVGWPTDALQINTADEMKDAILKFARNPSYATNIMITNILENDPAVPDHFATTVSKYRVKDTKHGKGLFTSTPIKDGATVCTYRGKWYASAIEFDQKFNSEPDETKKLHEAYSVTNSAPGDFTWKTTYHAFCANYSGAQFELIDATDHYGAAAAYANEAPSSTENTCQLNMTKTGYCVIEVQKGKQISAGDEILCGYNQEQNPLRVQRSYDAQLIKTHLAKAETERTKFDFKGMECAVYESPVYYLTHNVEPNNQVLIQVVTRGYEYVKEKTQNVQVMDPAPLTDDETLKTYYARMIQSIEKVLIRNLRQLKPHWAVLLKNMVDVLSKDSTCNANQTLQKAIRYVDNYRIHSFPAFEAAVFACVKIDAIDELQGDGSNYNDTTTYNWVLRDYLQGALNKCHPDHIKAVLNKKLTDAKTMYKIDISYIFDRLWSLHEQYYAEDEEEDGIYKKIVIVCREIKEVWGVDEFFEANIEQCVQLQIVASDSDHTPQIVEIEYDTKLQKSVAERLAAWKDRNPTADPDTSDNWEEEKNQLEETFDFVGDVEHVKALYKYIQCIDDFSTSIDDGTYHSKETMIDALQRVENWKDPPDASIEDSIGELQTGPFTNKILETRRIRAVAIYEAYLKENPLDQSNADTADAKNVALNFAVPFGDD